MVLAAASRVLLSRMTQPLSSQIAPTLKLFKRCQILALGFHFKIGS